VEDSRRNNIGLWQERNGFVIWPDFLRVRIDGTGFRSARILTWQHVMHDWSVFVLYCTHIRSLLQSYYKMSGVHLKAVNVDHLTVIGKT